MRALIPLIAGLFLALAAIVLHPTPVTASVTVAAGDTLSGIAARNGVSVSALAAANGISDPDRIGIGTRLTLPGGSGGGSSEATEATTSTSVGGSAGAASVTVAAGDTLSGIAARNGVSVSALAAANGISDPDRIGIGTRLTLPGGSGGGSSEATEATTSTSVGGSAGAASVTVAAGDTLSGIAARNGVSVSALAAANGISDPDRIGIGTRLTLPGGSGGGSSEATRSAGTRTGGRTPGVGSLLEQSAARHGVSADLVRAIAWQESGWNQSAVSSVGATGVMQLMPGTARWLGQDVLGRRIDRSRVEDNVDGGVAYLAWLIRHMGDERAGIAAYYQGQGSVSAHGPLPETDRYVASVLSLRGRV